MGGVGCVAGEPAAFSLGWGGRGCSSFLFWWQFVGVVIVDRYVSVRERSGSVLREPCGFPCGLEGDV